MPTKSDSSESPREETRAVAIELLMQLIRQQSSGQGLIESLIQLISERSSDQESFVSNQTG